MIILLLASAVFFCGWGAALAKSRRSASGLVMWIALAVLLHLAIGLISMSVMYHWHVAELFDQQACPWCWWST